MTALRCSFCNRAVSEVGRIISGPDPPRNVHICNECVEVCAGILRDDTTQGEAVKRFKQPRPLDSSLAFIIPVLILTGVGICALGYYDGGVSKLEELAVVWLASSTIAVLLGRWLRRLGRS